MARLMIIGERVYDAETMHGDDEEARDWFYNTILTGEGEDDDDGLIVHSNEIGDQIGRLKIKFIVQPNEG